VSADSRKQELLIATVMAVVVTAAVAVAAAAGARTVGAFVAGAGGATLIIFVALTDRKLQREKRRHAAGKCTVPDSGLLPSPRMTDARRRAARDDAF